MTIAAVSGLARRRRQVRSAAGTGDGAGLRRAALATALVIGVVWGWWDTGAADAARAVAGAGAELTRLLRFMAAIKAVLALGAVAAVWWRLGVAASPVRLAAYLGTAAAMGSGPGLIWAMAHVAWGAALLHGGLFAALLLLWRDPAVGLRLGAMASADRVARRGVRAEAAERPGSRPCRSPPGH